MRAIATILIGILAFGGAGCGQALAAVLAPQAAAMGAATQVVGQGVQGVFGDDLNELGDLTSTIEDVDRAIAEHPEDAERLTALRERLRKQQDGITQQGMPGRKAAPPRTDAHDRRADPPPALVGDEMAPEPTVAIDGGAGASEPHTQARPFAELRSSRLPPHRPSAYLLDMKPVRLTPSAPITHRTRGR